MNPSQNWIKEAFLPIFILFYLQGMESLPSLEFFSRNTFLKLICNSSKYLFPCILIYLAVIQILWLCFISSYKDEWATLIVLFLQLWIYISVFRSRTKIRLLTEELHRISNMLRVYTLKKKENVENLHLGVLLIRNVLGYIP
ncbi:hypothetical protein CEXT_369171 [Caerostris extrusa]|uniref:Uncharacterized protein n=1 Tax=Caerostris extrusa TaxID=172846 RepID=A0AAV4XGV4_CAEEX|nr:hypothetical protein CEXT_369171 [Caerostris extrusa]